MRAEAQGSPRREPAPIRCVVADDHPAIIDAVCRFLADESGIEVVGRASDGKGVLRLVEVEQPEILLVDIRLPDMSGLDVARRVVAGGTTAVLLYTAHAERALLLEALDIGARGFVLKEAPLEELLRAVRVVAAGGTYIDATLAALPAALESVGGLPMLSRRERDVLRLLAAGMRDEQVSRTLSISPHTVRTHVQRAMAKLDSDTRTQAVAVALRESMI